MYDVCIKRVDLAGIPNPQIYEDTNKKIQSRKKNQNNSPPSPFVQKIK